jgi:hypothetical protein
VTGLYFARWVFLLALLLLALVFLWLARSDKDA